MAKATKGNKTTQTAASVAKFIAAVPDAGVRQDCEALVKLLKGVTGEEPRMWGTAIVGFGLYHYKYASGREGDWLVAGFSPRKQNLTIYITAGLDASSAQLAKLGPHTTGKSCLYIKRLADVDERVLVSILAAGVKRIGKMSS